MCAERITSFLEVFSGAAEPYLDTEFSIDVAYFFQLFLQLLPTSQTNHMNSVSCHVVPTLTEPV